MDDREGPLYPLLPAGPRRSLAERLRGADSYGLLLILVLSSLLVTALVGDSDWGRFVSTAMSGATTLFAFWTSRPSVAILRAATIVVALSILASIAAVALGSSTTVDHMGRAGLALITAASPVVVARRLVSHPRVQGSTVLGALCIYLLLGLFFAYLYSTIGAINPPFFAQQSTATIVDYLYFSYATLTTVGYGDLTAGTDVGRMLAVSEALTGQLYLVTVVSLLVANLGRVRSR
jgi:hypothetical protein